MFDDILSIVLRAAYWVLVPAALLRFYMQAIRLSLRNSVGQFICAVTDFLVKPTRRVVRGAGGYDWASLIAALVFELLYALLFDLLSLRLAIFRSGAAVVLWLAGGVFGLLGAALTVALWTLVAYAVLSWIRADSTIGDVLGALVNPWLRPIRRRMPMVGGFDLSPLVLMVFLNVLLAVLPRVQGSVIMTLGGVLRN